MLMQYLLSTGTALIILYESYQPLTIYHNLIMVGVGMSYFGYDILCNKLTSDYVIHHIVTFGVLTVGLIYPYSVESLIIICSIEWSTLVLNTIPFLPKKYTNMLYLLFFILFCKFRILDWYYMFQYHTFLYVQIIPILALYSLNLYWFVVMCKKIAKPLKTISLHVVNQHIVSYTLMVNCILIWMMYPTITFSKIMSILLGISSYLYHKEIAYYYNGIPSIQSKWIILDVTVFHIFQAGYMYLVDYSFSFYIHFVNLWYIYQFFPQDISSASLYSFGIDIITLLYDNPTIELFTISLLFIYIHLINPFYDVSYVSTHLLICWYIHTRSNHLLNF